MKRLSLTSCRRVSLRTLAAALISVASLFGAASSHAADADNVAKTAFKPDGAPSVTVPGCLSADPQIKCGAKPGTYQVILTPKGAGGVLPDFVEVASLTPGVTVKPSNVSLPVVGGQVSFTLSGGNAGDVVVLQVNGTSQGKGSVEGTELCCNGTIKVKLPDCPKPKPVDLGIKKTGGTTPAPEVPAYGFSLKITNEGAAYTAAAGVVTVTDVVPAGMIFNSVSGSAGWICAPNSNVAAGTLITCTFGGGVLAAGPANPIGTISINATALGQMPFPDFTNCADVALAAKDGGFDTNSNNNHSCVTVSKQPKKKIDVAIDKTGETVDEAIVTYRFKLDIKNIADAFTGNGNIVVTDVVPAGMTFTSITGAPDWNCLPLANAAAGSTVSCSYVGTGPTAAGASLGSIKITARPLVQQGKVSFTNCADVKFTGASGLTDINPANDHSCATVSHGPKGTIGVPVFVPETPRCQPPLLNGPGKSCVCPRGTELKGGDCVPVRADCAPPRVPGAVAGSCVCPQGTHPQADRCVPNGPRCAPPMIQGPDDSCSCPRGTHLQRGICAPDRKQCDPPMVNGPTPNSCICPRGTHLDKGECVKVQPVCRPPLVAEGRGGQCVCPKGTVQRGGACIAPSVCRPPSHPDARGNCLCPPDMQMQNNACVPKKRRDVPGALIQDVPGFIKLLPHLNTGGGAGPKRQVN